MLSPEKNQKKKKTFNPSIKMVLFGSQLKIQIPIEFGVKNMNSQLTLHSPASLAGEVRSSSPGLFMGCLSPREMELSEDYACLISHGPIPKKTRIFENYIMESCGGDMFMDSKRENGFLADRSSRYTSMDFLSFCHACRKSLPHCCDLLISLFGWV